MTSNPMRWGCVKPMTMVHHHWVKGWCTWCSRRFAAPSYMQLYKAFHALPCEAHGDVHQMIALQNIPPRVEIDYTNWKGERATRLIRPQEVRQTWTDFHPEEQWLLDAFDLDKQVPRTFAMKDIHKWWELPQIAAVE